MFRFLILGFLRDGIPRHGYALAKAYGERSGGGISTGNFYRELQRLVGEGLVRMASNRVNVQTPRLRAARGSAVHFDATDRPARG